MRFSINEFRLVGNLTKDPEVKNTQSGMAIANLGIATNQHVKDKTTEEWVDKPTFLYFTCFDKLAEFVRYACRKGDKCLIEGRINNNSWTDEAGNQKSRMELVADNVIPFVSRKKSEAESAAPATVDDFPDQPAPIPEEKKEDVYDDIPF